MRVFQNTVTGAVVLRPWPDCVHGLCCALAQFACTVQVTAAVVQLERLVEAFYIAVPADFSFCFLRTL